jgi:hypothetical protein
MPVSPKQRAWLAGLPILRIDIDPTAEPSFVPREGQLGARHRG